MNVNDLFPSRFVKAHDLGGKQVTVTIRDATLEDVGHGAEKERKLALAFEKATKQMLLNRTNAMIIASMYGPETDAWKGKSITIYSARVKAFGAWHDALRVKEQIPARNVGAARMPDAMLEEPPLDDEEDLLDVDEGQEPRQADVATDGDVLFAKESPPHQRMWGQGLSVFGPDWDMARPWVLRQWSKLTTPDNVRSSATEFSDDEKSLLGDYLGDNGSKLQKIWPKQKAQMVQATVEPVANGVHA